MGPDDVTATFRLAGGFATTREAEHAALGTASPYVATVFDPVDHVVVLGVERAAELPERARLFVFPGHDRLVGDLSVEDLLATSAIDEVRGLGGGVPDPAERVRTQDFVRPGVEGGRVVLVLRPYDDGSQVVGRASYVPFEQPHPTPCCADH